MVVRKERAGKGSSYHRDDLSRDGIPHATGSLFFGWQKAMNGEMKISIVNRCYFRLCLWKGLDGRVDRGVEMVSVV